MNRVLSFLRLAVVLLSGLVISFPGPALAAGEKLNVLFIMADDLRPELGCYGAPVITPHIDALAREGVRFERAYCQYPLCNPSRVSLLTGRLPTATGVMDNGTTLRKKLPDAVTLPQLFKNNGYVTSKNGKNFHGGIDDPVSWTEGAESSSKAGAKPKTEVKPTAPSATTEVKPSAPSTISGPTTARRGTTTAHMRTSDRRLVLAGNGEGHGDHRTADLAIGALERHQGSPFFITCGFNKPHAEPAAPQRFYDLHPLEKITLPATYATEPRPPKGFPAGALPTENLDLFWNRPGSPDEAKQMIQAYRASTSWVDWNIGRVLAALDRLQLREKTVIVLWGDHGYHLGEMGKWSKHESLFETGTRVPLIISAPGLKGRGKSSPRIVQTLDIYPTLAALCGLTAPAELDGHDLRPLLDSPEALWEHPCFGFAGRLPRPHRCVRVERWRLMDFAGAEGGTVLIDEDADPLEQVNLANDPAHAETVKRLKDLLGPR